MAYRVKLNKKRKKAYLLTLSFWLPCVVIPPILVIAGLEKPAYWLLAFFYCGGALFWLHYYFCIRCESCGNSLGFVVLSFNLDLLKMPAKIHFCPFCGTNFDNDKIKAAKH
jgi:hypothetical protein